MNSDTSLSKNAKAIQNVLFQKGLSTKVIELSSSTRTAQDAATTIGCEVAQIVKSLLFKTKITNRPILALASGCNRVNEKSIAYLINEEVEKADANYVREITGFSIGGIPPLGHKHKIDHIFIDEDLLQYRILWAAAGTANAVFCLNATELQNLSHGVVSKIKQT